MASNDMIVRILGDSKSVERAFARSSAAAGQFNKNVTSTGVQLDKTTKKFSSFARGTAVGFGGAFALTQAVDIIRNLATVAAESQQVLGQTQVALESTGKSWAKYGDEIEDAVKAQSRLGFDDEALLRTFSLFIRNTDDVGEALRRNNLAMDVARARFIDLEQAANLVNKAALGQAGALRRLGIDAQKGATGLELLQLLTEKYGGSAEAASDDAATAFERSQVAVENLQESLGRLLLPVLGKLATRLEEISRLATNVADGLAKIGAVKIPEIELPFDITIGGQSVGNFAGDAIGKLKWFGPALPITIANEIANQFRDETEKAKPQLAASINTAMQDLISDSLTAAGTFGITKLPTSGENFARQFSTGIAGAIDAAQALASKTINTGKARIAAEKQAKAAAKAQEEAEKAADKELARRRAARAREQARQFRALGLAGTGEEIVPGVKNLQQRIASALRRAGSGELDIGSKLVDRLKLARNLLKKEGAKLTEDTRRVINDLLRTLNQGADKIKEGPLTKTTGLNADKVLAGLGLSPEQERQARARLSSFNSAGRSLSGDRRPTGNFRDGQPIVVESTTNVNLDGETVGRNVTRTQQKQKRRNPKQKRGPRSGI
jgi:hypothetical protein